MDGAENRQQEEFGSRVERRIVLEVRLGLGNVVFCGGRKTGEPGEKPWSREENQQQTQPT